MEKVDWDDLEKRISPIGLTRYAWEYWDCGYAADRIVGERKGYEIHAPMPVIFLTAHSIELALKAILKSKGFSAERLSKKPLGHNISKLAEEVCAIEGEDDLLNGDDLELLEITSHLHTTTILRYFQAGYRTLPIYGPLSELALKILLRASKLSGYKYPHYP